MPDAEDAKLLTLARAARTRTGTAEGAAVRDGTGRTYAACTVTLASFSLTAVQAAVASAVASGSADLEAVAVVGTSTTLDPASADAVRDLGGAGVPVFVADPSGTVIGTVTV